MSPADVQATFPVGLTVLLLATAGVGAILLLAGNRVLVAGLGVIGALTGAIAGWIAFDVLLPQAPAWVGAVALGSVAAVMLALSARLVMALLLALILGAAGWMSVSSAERHGMLDLNGAPAAAQASDLAPDALVQTDGDDDDKAGRGDLRGAVEERLVRLAVSFRAPQLQRHLVATSDLLGGAVVRATRQWTDTPPALRTLMFASAGMCAFLGLCLGLVAPKFTASGITAALGATLLVLCAAVTIEQFAATGDALPGGRSVWLSGWTLLTLTGAVIQTARKAKAPAKPAEE